MLLLLPIEKTPPLSVGNIAYFFAYFVDIDLLIFLKLIVLIFLGKLKIHSTLAKLP